QQAEKYRVRASDKEYGNTQKSLNKTVNDLEENLEEALEFAKKSNRGVQSSTLTQTNKSIHRDFEVRFNKISWIISVELSFDPTVEDLMEIGDHLLPIQKKSKSVRQIGIRLSLIHPFMIEYVGVNNSRLEPILKLISVLALSEVLAKE